MSSSNVVPKSCCVLFLYLFLLTIVVAAVKVPDNFKSHAKKLHNHCQKQTGVDEDIIRQGHDGTIPEDSQLKCYLRCLFDMVGVMDENNIIHLEYLIDILPADMHDVIRNLIDKCGTQAGIDSCDTAYKTVKCYFEVDKPTMTMGLSFIFD